MDQADLLLAYLQEQYAQARQHETLRTAATTFLTAAAAGVLALAFKDGNLHPQSVWIGVAILGIGAANWAIIRAHFKGNRFHTALAGKTRRALEKAIPGWTATTPTELRKQALAEHGLSGPDVGIGQSVNQAMLLVPTGTILIGGVLIVIAAC